MLEREEAALVRRAQGSIASQPAGTHHAMGRDEDAEPVLRAERSGCACGAGTPGECGELAVGDDVAARQVAQRPCERLSVRRQLVQVEVDVGEVILTAGEVRAQPRDQS